MPNPVADQPFLAARVQELGAGIGLPADAEPEAIRAAIRDVTGDARYSTAAWALAAEIRNAPGSPGAADALEELASTSR